MGRLMNRPTFKGPPELPSNQVRNDEAFGNFGGTGQSATVTGRAVTVSISGTFVATVLVQRLINGVWGTVDTLTAPAEKEYSSDSGRSWRLNCSAYTSGTVVYYIGE